jgi:hypothetical protein
MATNESADPAVEEADRRAERAKASLLSRVAQLKHRFADAGHTFDVRAHIEQHPLPAVGIALALGALAGMRRREPAAGEHSLSGAVLAGLAAVSLRIVRELAMGQLGDIAKRWWAEQQGTPPEAHGSHMSNIEPFLEH